jgi:hypothetical protein
VSSIGVQEMVDAYIAVRDRRQEARDVGAGAVPSSPGRDAHGASAERTPGSAGLFDPVQEELGGEA